MEFVNTFLMTNKNGAAGTASSPDMTLITAQSLTGKHYIIGSVPICLVAFGLSTAIRRFVSSGAFQVVGIFQKLQTVSLIVRCSHRVGQL